MSTISAYLNFNGNCREAMLFYQQCLGGELIWQTLGEFPNAEIMPKQMQDCILHATLSKSSLVLMGSDILNEDGLKKGNSILLMLNCESEEEMTDYYNKLSLGGIQTHPVARNIWGALLGNLTDKFGNQWLLHFKNN